MPRAAARRGSCAGHTRAGSRDDAEDRGQRTEFEVGEQDARVPKVGREAAVIVDGQCTIVVEGGKIEQPADRNNQADQDKRQSGCGRGRADARSRPARRGAGGRRCLSCGFVLAIEDGGVLGREAKGTESRRPGQLRRWACGWERGCRREASPGSRMLSPW